MASVIHVVAGVILNEQREVLLALRPLDKHQGGLWEFPGGKIEVGETVQAALARELQEEINLVVLECAPFLLIDHDYGDKKVLLDVWIIKAHSGTPYPREGQRIRWVKIRDLSSYAFPAANTPIVTALKKKWNDAE
ncbi:MAG: 8-oxo-dGTP diphosphatase MutT [Pseudohongiellaceae bacterium]|jgi:8-oxo-dGTP diphosphatase